MQDQRDQGDASEAPISEQKALLVTDVVDSLGLQERLGDVAAASLWRAHDRAARDLLLRWHGREIDKSDGFLMLFDNVSDAVGYALDMHRTLVRLPGPMQARAGIHLGRVTLRRNPSDDVQLGAKPIEVDGSAKSLAARAMSVARGGQTLLTEQARSALVGHEARVESHGHWRVKGLEHPIELFEAGDDGTQFAPPPDTDKVFRVVLRDGMFLPLRDVGHSLPAERDAFVGRERGLFDLAARFHRGKRLVSVVGVGGIGKTRFAQRFGWTWLGDFWGGVWFCDVSPARSLDGVLHAVAEGMGIPLGKADPVEQLGDALASRGVCLVILDNFEQVSDFAAQTVGRWLDRAPKASFVVTSRRVLGVPGEDVLHLEPLRTDDAVTLFLTRAEAVRGDVAISQVDQEAVASLVKLLDGLPLAIELAASRVGVMSPRVLLQRMSERFHVLVSGGGRPDRQSTLRAAFDWSWDLLAVPERAAFAQLSVFEGGFTMAAAEATLDMSAHAPATSPLEVLQSLVNKSLVRYNPDDRFNLLATVQEYAAEHLATPGRYEGSGPEALRAAQARHFSYFGRLRASMPSADFCAELDNLVLACRRASLCHEGPAATGALEGAWSAVKLRGPFRLGVELATVVRSVPDLEPTLQARVDRIAAEALKASGRAAEAMQRLEAALETARRLNDRICEGYVLGHLADLKLNQGRTEEARGHLGRALELARAVGDRTMESEALNCLGNLFENLGSLSEARSHYISALAAARSAGHRRWEGGSLGNLGLLHANMGRMDEARRYYEAAIAIASELGDLHWEGNVRCNLGLLHQVQDRQAEAREHLDRSLQIARDLGYRRLESIVRCNLGIVCGALGEVPQALAQFEGALTIARELADKRSEGQFLIYLGLLHSRAGRFDEGRQCLEQSERLLSEVKDRLSLGLLLCSRAEAEHLAGAPGAAEAALLAASALAQEVGAEPNSELGLALTRVDAIVRPRSSPVT